VYKFIRLLRFVAISGFTYHFKGDKLVLRAEQEKFNKKGGVLGWSL
jgi:hypothetical protein